MNDRWTIHHHKNKQFYTEALITAEHGSFKAQQRRTVHTATRAALYYVFSLVIAAGPLLTIKYFSIALAHM